MSVGLLLLCLLAEAQGFFNLTAEEVKVDSVLPCFTYSRPLGYDYADSVYSVTIEYPEFVEMTEAEVLRYQAVATGPLPTLPVIRQHIGVSRKQGVLEVSFLPLVYREGKYRKLVSFKLSVQSSPRGGQKTRVASAERYAEHSVLASGRWAKIRVGESGVYRLTESLIRKAGFSDLSRVKVYGYGGALQPERLTADYLSETDDLREVPVCDWGGGRLFYGQGPVSWTTDGEGRVARVRNPYSDYGYYFLTEGDTEPVDSATFVNTFYPSGDDYNTLYEVDGYAWYHGGRNLYDTQLMTAGGSYDYTLSSPTGTTGRGDLYICLTGDSRLGASVSLNDSTILTGWGLSVSDSYSAAASAEERVTDVPFLSDNRLAVSLDAGSGNARLDYVILHTDECRAAPRLTAVVQEPEYVGQVSPQDRHGDEAVDMVIIIPASRKLEAQAERIKTLHETADGLTVRIVAADELYNEFSSGTPDANAYRRYLRMLYDRAVAGSEPRYLLLLGDGAWDNRMRSSDWRGYDPDDFLLCYESEDSFSEIYCYVTDDYFCLMDDGEGDNVLTDKADIAVGRLPARTAAEAEVMVSKIIDYRQNTYAGSWQNTLCFMGDDGNSNTHMDDADQVATMVNGRYPSFLIKKIYWDAYTRSTSSTGNTYPDVTKLIKQQMSNGALVMNYTGHGAAHTLSHEMVVSLPDFAEATSQRLPLWVTASCDVMPFDGQEDNIGETAMLNEKGGAIAFFGTTRTVYSFYNRYMNMAFMRYVLDTAADGSRYSIGEAVRLAKNELIATGSDVTANKLQYTLLGDPALVLAAPAPGIQIDSINGTAVSSATARVSAGEVVTVKGHVTAAGDFNGVVTATVRDAEETITCKDNEHEGDPFTYQDRTKVLYQGSDSVSRGQFSFTFAVPKDISYADGAGLVTLYAVNNEKTVTLHGENDGFYLGGSAINASDSIGPAVYCYLNSPSFVNGGKVNATPYFYAELRDDSGINVSGSGTGHDLELIIDGEMARTYVLNDYFTFDFGDYRHGTVGFSIPELSEGRHRLQFRAWDVLNNSSTAELTFEVDPRLRPEIVSVDCTRNPATSQTTFIISHDRMGAELDVELDIYNMAGRQIWRHRENGVSAGQTYTINWDLTIDGGRRVSTGVYLFRVLLGSGGGARASKAKKLVVLSNN